MFHTSFTAVLFVTKGLFNTCFVLADLILNIFNFVLENIFLLVHRLFIDLLPVVKTGVELLYLKLALVF